MLKIEGGGWIVALGGGPISLGGVLSELRFTSLFAGLKIDTPGGG